MAWHVYDIHFAGFERFTGGDYHLARFNVTKDDGVRTWQVAALSDRIAAGVSVGWMATRKGLMVPGNNQTRGQSAFSFTHPALADKLDYPDLASIACPKPMLFFNGYQDTLFPIDGVERAYQRMQTVWQNAGAPERLVTKIWDVPHEFSALMQEETFAWLDIWLKNQR